MLRVASGRASGVIPAEKRLRTREEEDTLSTLGSEVTQTVSLEPPLS